MENERQEMRKGPQTRQDIIRKAAPIFQYGYEGAALSDPMKATGLDNRSVPLKD